MLVVEMKGFLSIVAASNLTLVQSIFIQQKISAPAPDPQNNFGAATLSNTIYQCVAERPPFCLLHLAVRLGGALHSSVAERPHFCLIHLAASSTATLLLLKEKLLK